LFRRRFAGWAGGWDSGTVRCLKAYILKTIALNQKQFLNLLTKFLRSFQIHKGPTSDIGTLSLFPHLLVKIQNSFLCMCEGCSAFQTTAREKQT
jgi:hypothetical protein